MQEGRREQAAAATAELAEITSERDQWFALANQTLARHLQRFGPVVGQLVGGRWRIVGVIPDIVIERPDRPVDPTVFLYLPPIASVTALIRSGETSTAYISFRNA